MKPGQIVHVSFDGQRVRGRVLLASANGRSLAVALEESLHTKDGIYLKLLPLLMNDEGRYEDLFAHNIMALEMDECADAEKDRARWN